MSPGVFNNMIITSWEYNNLKSLQKIYETIAGDIYTKLINDKNNLSSLQTSFFNHLCRNKLMDNSTYKWKHAIQPDWLPLLYCNILFPNLETNKIKIELDDNNLLNGKLISDDDKIFLQWNGYLSHLYDGILKLGVMNNNAKIEGYIGDIKIEFDGKNMTGSYWPGFLEIYS